MKIKQNNQANKVTADENAQLKFWPAPHQDNDWHGWKKSGFSRGKYISGQKRYFEERCQLMIAVGKTAHTNGLFAIPKSFLLADTEGL